MTGLTTQYLTMNDVDEEIKIIMYTVSTDDDAI